MNRADKDERVKRIRAGLTGLAVVFLLVLLGTVISRSSEDPSAPPAENHLAVPDPPNEPLAEIGAAPGTAPSSNASAAEPSNQAQ